MKKRLSKVLGLTLFEGGLSAAEARLTGGRAVVRRGATAPLQLDFLKDDPELAGREIRQALDAAGITERRCAVVVPVSWLLWSRLEVPEMSEADRESYLAMAAERAFPFPLDEVMRRASFFTAPGGARHATLLGVPLRNLSRLLAALTAARLAPRSVSFGVAEILSLEPARSEPRAMLLAGPSGLDIAVSAGGGVVALRALSMPDETRESGELDVPALLRDLRITLGQLPPALAEKIDTLEVYGDRARRESLAVMLEQPLRNQGITLVPADVPVAHGEGNALPAAEAAAARVLLERPTELQFLPPRKSRVRQMAARVGSRSTVLYGGLGVAVLLVVLGLFLNQHFTLSRLEREWSAIAPRVSELSKLRETELKLAPWFDDSAESLTVLRAITQAFPEDGRVWLKTMDIKDGVDVTCTGAARSNRDWTEVLSELRKNAAVRDLKIMRVQGDSPLQFQFAFQWTEVGPGGV